MNTVNMNKLDSVLKTITAFDSTDYENKDTKTELWEYFIEVYPPTGFY